MPIVNGLPPNRPVIYPKENYVVAKYLDLIRFLSLIQRKQLFFCRLDKLEDRFEGTWTNQNAKLMEMRAKNSAFAPGQLEALNNMYKKDRSLFCINCWNKFYGESAALWKIYSDFNKGILIKSSISGLETSLTGATDDISMSEVNYINYEKEFIPDNNVTFPVIHKHLAYKYEDEIRLLMQVSSISADWTHDWANEEVEEGVYIGVELDKLVHEIVISPYAPNWFYKMIVDLVAKYHVKAPIKKSELSIPAG